MRKYLPPHQIVKSYGVTPEIKISNIPKMDISQQTKIWCGGLPLIIFSILFFITSCHKKSNEKLESTFPSISKNIFMKKCSLYTCHSPAYAEQSGKLDLSDDYSYYQLVNVRSTMYPEIMRIKPGNPDESLLIQRLEGKAIVSVPLERKNISKEEIAILREWIKNGAKL